MTPSTKINKEFCDSVYQDFKSKKYGMRSCRKTTDMGYLYDLKFMYRLALEKDLTPCKALSDNCCKCTLNQIEETIKTL